MALKKFKAITAGTRWRIGNAYAEITTNEPEKKLLEKQHSKAGRNSDGRRSMRYKGGGHRQHYRIIDFKRDKQDMDAKVLTIEYDPNRTPFIALVEYTDGTKESFYIPLRMMHFEKENPTPQIKRTTLNDWAWAYPTFTFTIDKPKTDIKKITIDESGLLADVNKNNNSYPVVVAKK